MIPKELLTEKHFRLVKTYLPIVVMIAMGYWIAHLTNLLEKSHAARIEEEQRTITYLREAYKKSTETYMLMIEKQNEDAQKYLELYRRQ